MGTVYGVTKGSMVGLLNGDTRSLDYEGPCNTFLVISGI